jgi:hypothetical protein
MVVFFPHRNILNQVKAHPKDPLLQSINTVYNNLRQALMARPDGAVVRLPKKLCFNTVKGCVT